MPFAFPLYVYIYACLSPDLTAHVHPAYIPLLAPHLVRSYTSGKHLSFRVPVVADYPKGMPLLIVFSHERLAPPSESISLRVRAAMAKGRGRRGGRSL